MQKLILFDIDGTLLLTGGAGKMAFDSIFLDLFGIEGAWKSIFPDGRTDPSLINELFEKNLGRCPNPMEYKRVSEAYSKVMAKTLQEAPNFRLMPGVRELLNCLEERKMGLMGLATGNFECTAYLKLERAGLRDFFKYGGFGSDHRDRFRLTKLAYERGQQVLGRALDPENVFLVGDTPEDIRCGRRLGFNTIAVATGSTPKEDLARYRPDFLLESFVLLEEVLVLFE